MTDNEDFKEIDRVVYILRYWHNSALRGQIVHVGSGVTYPMRDPESLLMLIQKQVEIACAKEPPSGLR